MGAPNAALRDWRRAKGLKQEEFARLARTSRTMISMIESGRRSPGFALAKRLALLTGLPLESF